MRRWGVWVLALVLASACTPAPTQRRTPTRGPDDGTITPTPRATATTGGGVKPPLVGLVDREGVPAPLNTNADLVSGVVVQVDWADLEPERGQVRYTLIDDQLQRVRTYARQSRGALGVRLRVVGGIKAPAWAKQLGGAPVPFEHLGGEDPADDVRGEVGRFWTPQYGQAYRELHQQLAMRYDDDTFVREVSITRCAPLAAEPLWRQPSPGAFGPLAAAGLTVDLDRRCLDDQVEAHKVWRRTRSLLVLAPYREFRPNERPRIHMNITLGQLAHCRRQLGARCVLGNSTLQQPVVGAENANVFTAIDAAGGPIAFAAAPTKRLGDRLKALDWAANLGACSVELPPGYATWPERTPLTQIGQTLKENCS